MFTANRIQQFLDSAREWDSILRRQFVSPSLPEPRVAMHDGGIYFEMDLPGRQREEIEVEVDHNQLIVKVNESSWKPADEARWVTQERSHGTEEFRFQFPHHIDAEHSEVRMEDGVLAIGIHRPAEEQPRKLEVK